MGKVGRDGGLDGGERGHFRLIGTQAAAAASPRRDQELRDLLSA